MASTDFIKIASILSSYIYHPNTGKPRFQHGASQQEVVEISNRRSPDESVVSMNHQKFQVPKNAGILNLIRLFWGWVFPYMTHISREFAPQKKIQKNQNPPQTFQLKTPKSSIQTPKRVCHFFPPPKKS